MMRGRLGTQRARVGLLAGALVLITAGLGARSLRGAEKNGSGNTAKPEATGKAASTGKAAAPEGTRLSSPVVSLSRRKAIQLKPCPAGTKGCRDGWLRLAPKKGDFDLPGLRAALSTLKTRYRQPRAVLLRPGSRLPWAALLRAVDAIRRDAKGQPLFPIIHLDVGN